MKTKKSKNTIRLKRIGIKAYELMDSHEVYAKLSITHKQCFLKLKNFISEPLPLTKKDFSETEKRENILKALFNFSKPYALKEKFIIPANYLFPSIKKKEMTVFILCPKKQTLSLQKIIFHQDPISFCYQTLTHPKSLTLQETHNILNYITSQKDSLSKSLIEKDTQNTLLKDKTNDLLKNYHLEKNKLPFSQKSRLKNFIPDNDDLYKLHKTYPIFEKNQIEHNTLYKTFIKGFFITHKLPDTRILLDFEKLRENPEKVFNWFMSNPKAKRLKNFPVPTLENVEFLPKLEEEIQKKFESLFKKFFKKYPFRNTSSRMTCLYPEDLTSFAMKNDTYHQAIDVDITNLSGHEKIKLLCSYKKLLKDLDQTESTKSVQKNPFGD